MQELSTFLGSCARCAAGALRDSLAVLRGLVAELCKAPRLLDEEDWDVESFCSLFEIAGDACGLSDIDWPFTMYARAAEPALQDGKRADRGYTVTTGTQTKSHPVIGDIVITAYNNKHWLSSPCALCSRSQMAPADKPTLIAHTPRIASNLVQAVAF